MLHRHHYRGIPFHLNTIYYYYNTSSSSILMMMCSKSPSPSSSLLNHPPPPPATANNKYNNKIKFKSYNGFIIKPSNPHLSLLKPPPFFSISNNNVTSFSTYANIPSPVSEAYLEKSDDEIVDTPQPQLERLKVKLEEVGIRCKSYKTGQINGLLCPMCKGGDTGEKKLSLFIAEDCNAAMWNCFRAKCGWRGSTRGTADVRSSYNKMNKLPSMKKARNITESELNLEPLCNDLCEYFAERMISEETLRRNSVMQRRYDDQIVIAFTYRRKGELVSCKYRDLAKKFWQESDTEKVLYGLDDIEGTSDVIIVEGEMDKLAMEEAGFRNCVSVPDGAPPTVSSKDVPSVEQDKKYQYLWNCKDYLEKASRIILATDADEPGQALAEEIARRLGRERCWRVTWPSKNDNEQFKDANEVLMFMGPAVLREAVESAELYPIKGLFCFRDYFSEIDAYYHQTLGAEIGVSTGWRAMDDLYNVVPGELTIVTGVPNSGKSEWIDALLCNLNKSVGWKFALCSMENKVREHARKLLEKHVKKPFFNVRYGKSIERMSVEELEEGKQWLNDTFHLIRCENDCLPSTNWVLSLAKAAVLRHGVNGLVIDPYNELDHQRPPNQTETEYVSQMLTSIKRFAQHHSCHVWFVAHPKQLQQWTGKPPNLYDISGSAHFINKCDNGIVVHRNRDPDEGAMDQVQICVRKVRNKVSGTIGDAYLSYNRITGEYMDIK
uniref:twinkle homolog protein, chloroplastic/mitochondrial n=1 Tax=Erigeron canadensis TaxID=72917 RepID=UPI001CB8FD26|nr:twinkle homolog protein, chloroplastic/mitochondrial [Erigeron canadensis]